MSHTSKVSADKQSFGFRYQDRVSLKIALDLMPGEEMGIEVLDDIHHTNKNGISLIQTKHSFCGTLTNSDLDFWKSVYNWIKVIKENNLSYESLTLYTNQQNTEQSGIIQVILNKDYDKINENIEMLYQNTKNNQLKEYITEVKKLPKEEIIDLFKKINLQTNMDVEREIREKLVSFAIPIENIDTAFNDIMGSFENYIYNIIDKNEKVIIGYSTFRKEIGVDAIIQYSRSSYNPYEKYDNLQFSYNKRLDESIAYKQLKDIDIEEKPIIKALNELVKTESFFAESIMNGEITEKEKQDIFNGRYSDWELLHDTEYLSDNHTEINSEHKKQAKNVFVNCLKTRISNKEVSNNMIKGIYMSLSEEPKIGWLQNWENLYR